MRFRTSALVMAIAGLTALACREAPRTTPTEPLRPALINPVSTCDAAVSDQVKADIDLLFRSSDRSQVKGEWSKVVRLCPGNIVAAAAEQKIYIQLTINKYKQGKALDPPGSTTTEELLVADWDRTATFVGEPVYLLSPLVLGLNGNVGVFGSAGGDLINGVRTAGIRVNPNAVSSSHVFSIAPLADCSTLSSQTNLDLIPLCFDLNVNPVVTTFAGPDFVDIELCPVEGTPAAIMGRGHLAHPKINELALTPTSPGGNDIFGFSCSNALTDANTPAPSGLFGALRQLAQRTLQWLRPTAVYATHAGLTGKGCCLSPWGTVDPDIFLATFTADAVSLPPGPPEKGTWTIQSVSPGSVLVQASLGDVASNLAVINQQGGNCTNCGGLNFIGTVHGAPPENGTYLVSWRSLVSSPNVNYVPFILRDLQGDELARLEYRSGGPAQTGPLTFNGTSLVAGLPAGTWARNISQLFEITVDLVNNTASLSVNGTPVPGAQGLSFVSSSATNINTISIEIIGNDVQTIGWENIEIRRLVDAP